MTRIGNGRRWWALLLAAVMVARLLAPEGWMPVRGGVALCSGMAMGGGSPAHPAPERRCDFALAAPTAPPPPTVAVVLPPSPPVPSRPIARPFTAPGRGLAAPPPFATGPPAFA